MEMSPTSMRLLSGMLEQRTGQQLGIGRAWRLEVALTPLMREHALASLDAVAGRVAAGLDPALSEQVVEALLNNETSFYRDPAVFGMLTDEVLPRLAAARGAGRRLRVWSAGCSTGQEAYSLAMAIGESAALRDWAVDLVATDVSKIAVQRARVGRYPQIEIQRGLPVRRMVRWFDEDGGGWTARPELRSMVRFHAHHLLDPAPLPGRFDLILCRNVLLYFPAAIRARVFERLAAAIEPDGVLMLGAGETVIGQTGLFASHPDHRGFYRRA